MSASDETDFDAVVARAANLTSCAVSDAMDRLGMPARVLPGIVPLDAPGVVAGTAFTVDIRPVGTVEPHPVDYLDEIPEGSVVMLAAGAVECSVWGGNRGRAAIARGAVGAVADGRYRDVDEHRELGLPVWGRGPTPLAGRGRVTCIATGGLVVMAGVPVESGDLVVADASGVVVAPRARAEEIVRRAEQVLADEAAALAAGRRA